MKSGVGFGNPYNPFGSAEAPSEDKLMFNTILGAASNMVSFMSRFQDEVKVEEFSSDTTVRTLEFVCGAPFDNLNGLFINGHSGLLGDRIRHQVRTEVAIQLGDLVLDDEITQRWIDMRRTDGKKFGVAGASRLMPGGAYEAWDGLAMRMKATGDRPAAELWAVNIDAEGAESATQLVQEPGLYFGAHYESLDRALGRTLQKRTGKPFAG